jgi:alkyl hydroperoxide reductase subunit AhpC
MKSKTHHQKAYFYLFLSVYHFLILSFVVETEYRSFKRRQDYFKCLSYWPVAVSTSHYCSVSHWEIAEEIQKDNGLWVLSC